MGSLLDDLRDILGDDGVLEGERVAERSAGWAIDRPSQARAILRPRTTDEVARAVARCAEEGQPVCVQGGMTGLVLGNVARPGEIALSLERMDAIEEIDPLGRTMTVQSGVPLQRIQEVAEEQGLLFPLDLGARGSCHIGGNVATNAGGNRVIRFGMTRDLVLGLEAVLADGTVLSSLNTLIKNNAGYDLKHLFIGSEGTLGIVTRVVLKLERKPRSHGIALCSAPDFESVTSTLQAMQERLGPKLSAFEVMWREFYELVTTPPAKVSPPLPHGSPFYLLIESLGSHPESDQRTFEDALGHALEEGWVEDAVIGSSAAERDRLWEMRDSVELLWQLGPICTFDVSLPIRTMESYVEKTRAALDERFDEMRCFVFGHMGDGNLHLVVSVDNGSRETRGVIEEIVYGSLPAGASVSAEHGIGLEKRLHLPRSRSETEIALMQQLKRTLDPRGILNPGRVFAID